MRLKNMRRKNNMNDRERGKQIIESVYKSALQALFAIGVRNPKYIDAFSAAFMASLDREFFKIGLFQPQNSEAQEIPVGSGEPSAPTQKDISQPISALGLNRVIVYNLTKAGITTIDQLMTTMQQQSLTDIKGVKEKSAKQILECLRIWNS